MRLKETFLKGAMLLFLMLAFLPSYGINQSSTVDEAIALYDEEKYHEAIALFLTVDENDSSFVRMTSELALTYNATGNYDSSILCCRRGLEEISSYRNNIYGIMATSYDMKGVVDSAIYYYQKAIEIEPYNYLDHFNLGVTYYNSDKYLLATGCFQEALRCNPFHSSSHLYLGLLAARQKQLTKAMLSIETFLMLEPHSGRSNKYLVFLNNLSQNYIDTSYGDFIEPFLENEAYEFVDHLIRSRVVLVDDFETVIDFNAPVVKQTQVLFDKIEEVKADDFWTEMYWEFFSAIKSNGYIEPMLCTILRSAGSEVLSKWVEKNDKLVAEFYNVGSHLSNIKFYKYLDLDGDVKRYTVEYDENGGIYSIGNTENEMKEGYWVYFWSHGGFRSEGLFENDKKSGLWKYYAWEGNLDFSTMMQEGKNDGPAHKYHPNEALRYSLDYVNDNPEGEVVFYSKSGALTENINYKQGLRNGLGMQFYGTGDTSTTYHYKDNKLDGERVDYHTNGTVLDKSYYQEGLLNGPYVSYHYNGQLESKGDYKDGNRTGEWQVYFEDGTISQQLIYNDTVITGERRDYFRNGSLSVLYRYNGKGELNGETEHFTRSGHRYLIEIYNSDKIFGIKNFNGDEELIDEYLSDDGSFSFKTYHHNGKLKKEGHFKNSNETGKWTSYWINGNKQREIVYEDGEIVGESMTYFKNGQLKDIIARKSEGEFDRYTSYHINGEIASTGLQIAGKNTHHWYYYRIDGSLEQKSYYADGLINGWFTYYAKDNKTSIRDKYDEGILVIRESYNEAGEIVSKVNYYKDDALRYFSDEGQLMMEASVLNFRLEDSLTWHYPSGGKSSQTYFENDIRQGDYLSWSREGHIDGKGHYMNGDKYGTWLWYYDNGEVISDENHYLYDEKDSVQKYFNEDGILVEESYYQNGDKHGPHIWYNDLGVAMVKFNYWNDELLSYQQPVLNGWGEKIFIENGNEKIVSHYVSGQISLEIQLKDFIYEGELIKYNEDGAIYQKRSYTLGLTNGLSESYYANGNREYHKTYMLGELNGESQWYYLNGNIKKKRQYYLGDSEGTDLYYNESGEQLSAEVYFGDSFMRFAADE